MSKIFDMDSPLFRGLSKLADIMILNIIFIICCIPIVTIGASVTAMSYVTLKMKDGEEGYIFRTFFKSFKQNFKQATIIWLILLLVILIMVGDIYIIINSGLEFHIVLKVIIGVVGFLIVFTTMYVFPVLAKFDNTIKNTIKNAFIMSILQFPKTILMIIMWVVPVGLALLVPQAFPIAFMFGLSAPAFVSALLYNKFFQKLEDRVMEENAPAEEEAVVEGDDERIFKDELDETLVERQIEQK